MKRTIVIMILCLASITLPFYHLISQHLLATQQDLVVSLGGTVVQALIDRDIQLLTNLSRDLEISEQGIYYDYAGERIVVEYLPADCQVVELVSVESISHNTIRVVYSGNRPGIEGIGFVEMTFAKDKDGWKLIRLQYDV